MDADIVQPHLRAGQSSGGQKSDSNTHKISSRNEGAPVTVPQHCEARSVEEQRVSLNPTCDPRKSSGSGLTSRLPGRETQERLAIRSMLVPSEQSSEIPETQPCNLGLEQTQNHTVERSPQPPTNPGKRLRPDNRAMQSPEFPRPLRASERAPVADATSFPRQQISLRALTGRHLSEPRDPSAVISSPDTHRSIKAPSKIYKLKMLDTKKAELVKNKLVTKAKGKGVTRAIRADDHQIACECGSKEISEDMMCCDLCESWQHTECYGFTSTQDPRIPNYHVCYSCLLSKFEERLLEEMRGLALFRKAVKLVWDKGSFPANNRAFSNALGMLLQAFFPIAHFVLSNKANDGTGCDLPTASQITRRLLEEGFIAHVSVTRTGRQKKAVNGGPVKYRVVKTPEVEKIKEAQYFDPLAKISHHVRFSSVIR